MHTVGTRALAACESLLRSSDAEGIPNLVQFKYILEYAKRTAQGRPWQCKVAGLAALRTGSLLANGPTSFKPIKYKYTNS